MGERGMPCMKINLAIMHATDTLSLYIALSPTGRQTVVRHILSNLRIGISERILFFFHLNHEIIFWIAGKISDMGTGHQNTSPISRQ
jgi:hypothetical protein